MQAISQPNDTLKIPISKGGIYASHTQSGQISKLPRAKVATE